MRGLSAWKSGLILLAAFVALASGVAYGQNQKNKKEKEKEAAGAALASSLLPDNQLIDLTVSQMLGAWQAGDVESLRKFYADDVAVVSGGWEPPIFGWADFSRAYQAQMARSVGSHLDRTNSYIKVTGDMAWVTYQWQYAGTVDGKPMQALGHTTLVLQKRAGNWVIVLNHTSALPTDVPATENSSLPVSSQATAAMAPNTK